MGAQLALAYAAKYPDMVSGLIVSALPLFESPDSAYDQLGAMNPKIAWILRGKRARLLRLFTRYAEGPSMKIAGLVSKGDYPPHVVQDGVRHSWASFDRSMKNVVMQYDAFADIKKINCPIHFIFADKDTIAKNPQNKLRPYLGSKHSLTMVHGSHQIPLEHAKIIAERILSV